MDTQITRVDRPWRAWLLVGAGLAVACLLYWPTLEGGFLADDYWLIDQAQTTTFTERPFEALRKGNFYYLRPVTSLWWSAAYELFGFHPFFHRAVSLLFHLLAALAVFRLLRRMTKRGEEAAAGVFAFAVFPVHPEAVAWVSANSDLVAALFLALALERYLAWREGSEEGAHPTMAVIFGVLAMLGKESAYALPVVLLAAEVLPGNRRTRRERARVIGWLTAAAVGLVAAKYVLCGGQFRPPTGVTPWSSAPGNFAMGVLRLFFPAARSASAAPANFIFMGALVLAAAAFIWRHGSRPRAAFPLLLMAITLIPPALVSRVGPHLEFSRTLYLPSLGMAMLVAVLLGREEATSWPRAGRLDRLVPLILAPVMLLALSWGLHLNLAPWVEAGRASLAVEQSFRSQSADFKPGQSALVEGVPITFKGIPFHSNSYDLSVAFSMVRFPEEFKARNWADRDTLPFCVVIKEAPEIEVMMTPVKKIRDLRKGLVPYDYHLRWSEEAGRGD